MPESAATGIPEQRGPNCRLRETEEQAKRDALTSAEASKAATDRAAKFDADAAAILAQLNTSPAPQEADPQASAFSSLTGWSTDFAIALYAFWLSLAFELGAMFTMLIAYSDAPAVPALAKELATEPLTETLVDLRACQARTVDRWRSHKPTAAGAVR